MKPNSREYQENLASFSAQKIETSQNTTEQRKSVINNKQLLAGSLALALFFTAGCSAAKGAGASLMPSSVSSGSASPEAATSPSASIEVSPSPSPEKQLSVEDLEISAYLSDKEIAQAIMKEIQDMTTANMNVDVYRKYDDGLTYGTIGDLDTWIDNQNQPVIDTYMKALCGEDYAANPQVEVLYSHNLRAANFCLDHYFSTYDLGTNSGVGGLPIYEYNIEYTSLDVISKNRYVIHYWEHNNFDQTNLAEYNPQNKSLDGHGILTVQFQRVKNAQGKEIIQIISVTEAEDAAYYNK